MRPLLAIPVADLTGALLPRQHAAHDHTIEIDAGSHGRRSVGRIMVVSRATGSDRGAWFWTITGPAAPDAGVALSGDAGSLEEARLAFRAAFDRLIACSRSMCRECLYDKRTRTAETAELPH
jgi:hypothetical protein